MEKGTGKKAKDSSAHFGFEAKVPVRKDLAADTATRVNANPQLRSHLAGLLRSGRQLLANPPFKDSDTALCESAVPDREDLRDMRDTLPDGWLVATNLNNVLKRTIIRLAAEVAGLKFGKDVVVEF